MKASKLALKILVLSALNISSAQTLAERTYVVRVETMVAEAIGGVAHTCVIVYADGRFRKETNFLDSRNSNRPDAQVFLGTLSEADLKDLEAIISDAQFQGVKHLGPGAAIVSRIDSLSVSIPKEHSVQNFAFNDEEERKPFDKVLKPFVHFINSLDRRKLPPAKDMPSNNCEAPRVVYRSSVPGSVTPQ